MPLLPDIDENGQLKPVNEPKLYTPPTAGIKHTPEEMENILRPGSTEMHNDRAGKPYKFVEDKPTMQSMASEHDCEPNGGGICIHCSREMLYD